MALSYYGWQNDQVYAASYLKPGGREDKNVNPWELVDFVTGYSQLRALTRIGGDLELVKIFISNGIPVILETSEMYEGYDWLGHYRTVVGYDNNSRTLTIDDSFLGQGTVESYEDVDPQWQHFNRRFVVVYRPQDQPLVERILGERNDPIQAAQHAFEVAQAEARQDPNNAFAWFNMGTALVMMSDYERAAAAFDQANSLQKLPWRMLWYQFGPYEAYYQVERYNDVIGLAEANLTNGGEYVEETHYWLGKALAAQGKKNEALTAFRDALRRNPDFENARVALDELNKNA
jgi:tetratricopeptide (TPR) repeat protein